MKTFLKPLGILTLVLTLMFSMFGSAQAVPGGMMRVSIASNGTQANDSSFNPGISADGRYVTFASYANNLVGNDNEDYNDIFIYDTQTNTITRISIDPYGADGNGDSDYPSISADGRYVAFESNAENLVDNDTNEYADIFLRDTETNTTTIISVSTNAAQQGDFSSSKPSISANGRYVAFESYAENLVDDDNNGMSDIFVHDTETGATILVSVTDDELQADNHSFAPSISADGRYVAFTSHAVNLVEDDDNESADIFVRDTEMNTTIRVSVATGGAQADAASSKPVISADGRFVAFESQASNLVNDDNNLVSDIFLHDIETGITTRISVASNGAEGQGESAAPAISANGRYVTFESRASNLVGSDTNAANDIFVHDTQTAVTTRSSVSASGLEGYSDSYTPAISADGRMVAFNSYSANLVSGDTNGKSDVFRHENFSMTFHSVRAQDGWILESGENTSKGGKINSGGASLFVGDNASNRQYRAILSFDTSPLPQNASITSVSLAFRHAGVKGTSPFKTHGKLFVDMRKGAFSLKPALQKSDFNAKGTNKVMIYSSATTNGWFIRNLGAKYYPLINRAGVTQFRLRFKLDDNNDFNADYLKIYSGNAAIQNAPRLVIKYQMP